MAKGFQRPNKEVRKPKAVKGKPPVAQTSPFGSKKPILGAKKK